MATRRGFGKVRRLPSRRYQASYIGPGADGKRSTAPATFDTAEDAAAWLRKIHTAIAEGVWTPATGQGGQMKTAGRTFGDWAETWMRKSADYGRKPRTLEHYRHLLDRLILPTFGDRPIRSITADQVDAWHTMLGTGTPTMRAHAYSLLKTIMTAATEPHVRLIDFNPCAIRGAGTAKRARKIRPATLPELGDLVAHMPEKYRVMTLIAAWCGLRFGELTELRRADLDLTNGVIRIRRGVVRTDTGYVVGSTKRRCDPAAPDPRREGTSARACQRP